MLKGSTGIDTRILYEQLASMCSGRGVHIELDSRICKVEDMRAVVLDCRKEMYWVSADMFFYAVGCRTQEVFKALFDVNVPLRFYKSHLTIVERLGNAGLFYVDDGEAAIMHHGQVSIVGLNKDATEVASPCHCVELNGIDALHKAAQRLVPTALSGIKLDLACIKIDNASFNVARSVDINDCEAVPGHVFLLPGKMTEAPVLVGEIARKYFSRLKSKLGFRRPCDDFVDRLKSSSVNRVSPESEVECAAA